MLTTIWTCFPNKTRQLTCHLNCSFHSHNNNNYYYYYYQLLSNDLKYFLNDQIITIKGLMWKYWKVSLKKEKKIFTNHNWSCQEEFCSLLQWYSIVNIITGISLLTEKNKQSQKVN